MAERLQIRAFKPRSVTSLDAALAAAARASGMSMLDSNGRHTCGSIQLRGRVSKAGIATFVVMDEPKYEASHPVFVALGRLLECAWIEVRIQEGNLWDYVLYRGADVIDLFSTWPEYWCDEGDTTGAEEERARWHGNPRLLAAEWGLTETQIERYVEHWPLDRYGMAVYTDKRAYPTDEYCIGDARQMHDFLRAMGIEVPTTDDNTATDYFIGPWVRT